MIPNGDMWAAEFLRNEPNYNEAEWLAAYATVLSRCKPELSTEDVTREAYAAFAREGDWNNPKVAAGCDAVFGPLLAPRRT
jgi:predicted transcriptional regulator YdeE